MQKSPGSKQDHSPHLFESDRISYVVSFVFIVTINIFGSDLVAAP
jgi:hypothetical protein